MTAMMTDSPHAAAAIRPMMYRSWLMSCTAITIQHVLCQHEGQHARSRQKACCAAPTQPSAKAFSTQALWRS